MDSSIKSSKYVHTKDTKSGEDMWKYAWTCVNIMCETFKINLLWKRMIKDAYLKKNILSNTPILLL